MFRMNPMLFFALVFVVYFYGGVWAVPFCFFLCSAELYDFITRFVELHWSVGAIVRILLVGVIFYRVDDAIKMYALTENVAKLREAYIAGIAGLLGIAVSVIVSIGIEEKHPRIPRYIKTW